MTDKDLIIVSVSYLLSATEDFADRLSQERWKDVKEGDKTNAHFQSILAFVKQHADLVENFLKEQEELE